MFSFAAEPSGCFVEEKRIQLAHPRIAELWIAAIYSLSLFVGTRGSRRFEGDSKQGGVFAGGISTGSPQPSPGLRSHIEEFGGVGRDGIKGCHRKDNFEGAVEKLGGRIENAESMSSIEGVERVTYKLPKMDKAGNPTGEMRTRDYTKTVYDPGKLSTDEYVVRGMEAATDAARRSGSGTIGHEWTGCDSRGVLWHGYTDSGGKVTSFFPTE